MDKWIDFYEPFFESRDAARKFVEAYEILELGDHKHSAKIMMHQAQRLISLADELPKIRPGEQSLQLLFLLICAEHVAKLHDNFDVEGRSRAYVRQFFENFLSEEERDRLRLGFSKLDRTPFTLREVVDLLYDVRCDVVHEGHYWGFHFNDGTTPMLNTEPDVIANMQLIELRALVVSGCINAVCTYAGRPNE